MPLSDIRHHFSIRASRCPGNAEECGSRARAVMQQEGAPGGNRGGWQDPSPSPTGWAPSSTGNWRARPRRAGPDPQGSPRGNLFQPWIFPSDAKNVNKKHTLHVQGE